MGPTWGQRAGPTDPTRLNVRRLSSLTSANNFHPSASPSEKGKVAGSIPALATSEAIFALTVNLLDVLRRLYRRPGPEHQPPRHAPVLGSCRHPESSTDARGRAGRPPITVVVESVTTVLRKLRGDMSGNPSDSRTSRTACRSCPGQEACPDGAARPLRTGGAEPIVPPRPWSCLAGQGT